MPKFIYTAKTIKGQITEGIVEAADCQDALVLIKSKKLYPIKIKKQYVLNKNTISKEKAIKMKELSIFCRQFSIALSAGISIVDSLDIIQKQAENNTFAQIIGEISQRIQNGYSLSESMGNYPKVFPLLLISMVETGEISGKLENIMTRMADHFEKENKMIQKFKASITYPIMVSMIAILVVIFLLTFIFPTFINMFEGMGANLPIITRMLIFISQGIEKFWPILIIGIIGGIYVLNKYKQTPLGKYRLDRLKYKAPFWGKVEQKIFISRFSRTTSVLIHSGIDLLKSLEISKGVINNEYLKEKMKLIEDDTKKGLSLAKSIKNSSVFLPMVYQMIKVGEDTGTLDVVLEKVADFYDEEIELVITQSTTMVEPLIIIILGGIVGFIVVATILPMFEMYHLIG